MIHDSAARIRIAFVVTALTLGGAEMMLWKLLSRIDRRRFDVRVIALSERTDTILERFRAIDVPHEILGMRPRLHASWKLLRLAQAFRKHEPDIVQGWLYHANVASTLAATLARIDAPVMWNIRGTLPSPEEKNRVSSFIIRLSGLLSSTPAVIVNNSVASAIEHERALGYPAETGLVIANGFDTDTFKPRPEARTSVRAELGLPPDAVVVGLVGRYHAMKDHATFIRAAALTIESHPSIHYLLAGAQVDRDNAQLSDLIRGLGIEKNMHLLGRRHDTERLTAAVDVACSSSAYGEGFPNVIGEAMSCGVPCVVTDVGDSARIVDDTGKVVPPRSPQAFARALIELVDSGSEARSVLGRAARKRIVQNFSLDAITQRYEELYARVYGERTTRSAVMPAIPADGGSLK